MRPSSAGASSVNQRLPSGPAVMPSGAGPRCDSGRVFGDGPRCGDLSNTAAEIFGEPQVSVRSGSDAPGLAPGVMPVVYSVTLPVVVILPMPSGSVNQRLPSGTAVMDTGLPLSLLANVVTTPGVEASATPSATPIVSTAAKLTAPAATLAHRMSRLPSFSRACPRARAKLKRLSPPSVSALRRCSGEPGPPTQSMRAGDQRRLDGQRVPSRKSGTASSTGRSPPSANPRSRVSPEREPPVARLGVTVTAACEGADPQRLPDIREGSALGGDFDRRPASVMVAP
jgi:hypothetical protein